MFRFWWLFESKYWEKLCNFYYYSKSFFFLKKNSELRKKGPVIFHVLVRKKIVPKLKIYLKKTQKIEDKIQKIEKKIKNFDINNFMQDWRKIKDNHWINWKIRTNNPENVKTFCSCAAAAMNAKQEFHSLAIYYMIRPFRVYAKFIVIINSLHKIVAHVFFLCVDFKMLTFSLLACAGSSSLLLSFLFFKKSFQKCRKFRVAMISRKIVFRWNK